MDENSGKMDVIMIFQQVRAATTWPPNTFTVGDE